MLVPACFASDDWGPCLNLVFIFSSSVLSELLCVVWSFVCNFIISDRRTDSLSRLRLALFLENSENFIVKVLICIWIISQNNALSLTCWCFGLSLSFTCLSDSSSLQTSKRAILNQIAKTQIDIRETSPGLKIVCFLNKEHFLIQGTLLLNCQHHKVLQGLWGLHRISIFYCNKT